MKRNLWLVFALLVVFSMIAAQCGGKATEAPPEPEPTEAMAEEPAEEVVEEPAEEVAEEPAEEMMAEVDFAVMPGGALEAALAGEYAGGTVTVDGPFTDPDDVFFAQSMEAFEEATGITVNYIGDKEFEGRLSIAVDAGNPPDIVDFPQPGLLANFARQDTSSTRRPGCLKTG
jgi:alpha-glucoside transport system substrate-binding protein